MRLRRGSLVALGLAVLMGGAGCHHGAPAGTLAIRPPFSQDAEVLWLRPQWHPTGAGVEVSFVADNRLRTPLYVRLENPHLVDGDGALLGASTARLECRLAPGDTADLLQSEIPLSGTPPRDASVTVDALAIPLAEPGRELYRQWAWLRRPGQIAAIDAELGSYDALPFCASPPPGS